MKANPEIFQFITLGNTGWHSFQIGDMTTKPHQSHMLHYLVLLLIQN